MASSSDRPRLSKYLTSQTDLAKEFQELKNLRKQVDELERAQPSAQIRVKITKGRPQKRLPRSKIHWRLLRRSVAHHSARRACAAYRARWWGTQAALRRRKSFLRNPWCPSEGYLGWPRRRRREHAKARGVILVVNESWPATSAERPARRFSAKQL